MVEHPIAFICLPGLPVLLENGVQPSVPIKVPEEFAQSVNSTPRKPNSIYVVYVKILDMIEHLHWNLTD